MSTYKVTLPFVIYVTAEIDADSEQEAIDEAINDIGITNYCGNGGDDRLVGGWDTKHTIECGDFIDSVDYLLTAELVEGGDDDKA